MCILYTEIGFMTIVNLIDLLNKFYQISLNFYPRNQALKKIHKILCMQNFSLKMQAGKLVQFTGFYQYKSQCEYGYMT
jgi:hypothetical protein